MLPRYGVLVLGLPFWLVVRVYAASIGMAWDETVSPAGHEVLRCTVPSGGATCVPATVMPGMPLPGTARTYTDTTATGAQCWTVKGIDRAGIRSTPATTAAGVPYICQQSAGLFPPSGGLLPPPATVTVTQVGSSVRLTWLAPTFTAATVPATALTGYEIWRKGHSTPPVPDWTKAASLGSTVLTWEDATPFLPGTCYEVSAWYGTTDYKEAATVCLTLTAAPAPLPAPSNLREVVP
jgi:hypothetical protein